MEITFNYIRNRIREHSKKELIQACYNILDDKREEIRKPIWFVFLLMKWTYLYGGEKYPLKPLTQKKFSNILKCVTDFNQDHISNFIKSGKINRAFHILYSQQFYLQTTVYKEKFATQLKIYNTLKSKYDINQAFKNKTDLTIFDFIKLMHLTWLYINIGELKKTGLFFNGFLEKEFLQLTSAITEKQKVINYLKLLLLDPVNPNEKIKNFKRSLKKEELQSMERTFFTLYPFQYFNGKIKLIHESVFNYSINYYIYDFLKSNDDKFTTEFGIRFEKYVELGIKELKVNFTTENKLKNKLPKNSKVVDFLIEDSNIFIECKAIELQAYPSVNPTDELIYNSLKDSLVKAYFQQLLTVSRILRRNEESWGIILTYKKLYWSQFIELYEISKTKIKEKIDNEFLPPQNVFIIDIYTWDRIVNIVNDEKITLIEILKLAKKNNSNPKTKKQTFDMHLDGFKNNRLSLSYLNNEIEQLDLEK